MCPNIVLAGVSATVSAATEDEQGAPVRLLNTMENVRGRLAGIPSRRCGHDDA